MNGSARVRQYEARDRETVITLWGRCDLLRPWNDPRRDIERKLARDPENFLVYEQDGAVAGTIMIGYDGHRGWVNYLAVDPDAQRAGIGRLLMREAERMLTAMGCPKLNLQVRTSNDVAIGFYRRLGYAVDDCVSLGKRLEHDE